MNKIYWDRETEAAIVNDLGIFLSPDEFLVEKYSYSFVCWKDQVMGVSPIPVC